MTNAVYGRGIRVHAFEFVLHADTSWMASTASRLLKPADVALAVRGVDLLPVRLTIYRGALFRSAATDAQLREFGGHHFSLRDGIHLLVDVENATVLPDIKRPPGRERLVFVDDAIGPCDGFRRVTQQRVIDAKRLRELPVDVGCVDADRKIRHIELPNRVATLTE